MKTLPLGPVLLWCRFAESDWNGLTLGIEIRIGKHWREFYLRFGYNIGARADMKDTYPWFRFKKPR